MSHADSQRLPAGRLRWEHVSRTGTAPPAACALRADTLPRPPTAEEEHSRGSGVVTETNYFRGIYAVGYVPTPEDRRRAAW